MEARKFSVVLLLVVVFALFIPLYQGFYNDKSLEIQVRKIKTISQAVKENPEYLEYLKVGGH